VLNLCAAVQGRSHTFIRVTELAQERLLNRDRAVSVEVGVEIRETEANELKLLRPGMLVLRSAHGRETWPGRSDLAGDLSTLVLASQYCAKTMQRTALR
jgi:hypothetical protein